MKAYLEDSSPTTGATMANSTYDPMGSVSEFHAAFNVKHFIDATGYERVQILRLRLALIKEEFKEVTDEILDSMNGAGDRSKLAKELADLLYVTYGCADIMDIPLPQVFDAVHISNMSKLGSDGKPVLSDSGKVLKGPNYIEADVDSVLFDFTD